MGTFVDAKFRVAVACAATVAVTFILFSRSRRHSRKRMEGDASVGNENSQAIEALVLRHVLRGPCRSFARCVKQQQQQYRYPYGIYPVSRRV